MARTAYGKHATQVDTATYPDDPSVPIGSDEWNASPSDSGMLGFSAETIASATSITPSNTVLNISGSTDVATIAQGNTNEYDLLYVFTSGTVTLVHNTGNLQLISGANKDLSTTVPTILIRKGTDWVEYGGGGNVTGTVMSGHIIPDTNDTYDIGSAEFKIRDMYVSDNSLWVGDDHKIDIQGGKMKFKKRKTASVPAVISSGGGNEAGAKSHSGKGTLGAIKLNEWVAYARSLGGSLANAKPNDIFRTGQSDDWDTDEVSITSEQASAIVANTAKVGLSNTAVTDAHLAGNISLSKLANGTAGKILGFNASTGVPEEQDAPSSGGLGALSHDTTDANHNYASSGSTSDSTTNYDETFSNVSAWSGYVGSGSNGGAHTWQPYVVRGYFDPAKPPTVVNMSWTQKTSGTSYLNSQIYVDIKDINGNVLASGGGGNVKTSQGYVAKSLSYSGSVGAHEYGTRYWCNASSCAIHSNTWDGNASIPRTPSLMNNANGVYYETNSTTNPSFVLDFGSSSRMSSVSIKPVSSDTETVYQLQFSEDNTNWTTRRTINKNLLTDNAYNYIRINPITARYFRLRGNSGNSVVCAIDEVKIKNNISNDYYIDNHDHFDISATDTSLGLDGT